jgi:hypothetical protein
MKGVEFLRSVYAASRFSIAPARELSKLDMVESFARGIGLDPEEILKTEATSEVHRTYMAEHEREDSEIRTLSLAVKELIRKELLNEIHSLESVSIHA